jgi:acetyl-CoA carboxylase biotin carboxylase subunit
VTFRKLLIANRGEIAMRVVRACREIGISPVAVYSEADQHAMHVRMADEAYCIGPAPAGESYLRIDRIVDAAKRAHVEAVHPGYGFLAENHLFAQACIDAGLVFVGPSPTAMRQLGLKTEARRLMRSAGVPVVPGGVDPLRDLDEAQREADTVGYPVALKAVAGGGGKGLRIVTESGQLAAAFRQAHSEAAAAFGDADVYLERAIEHPRHIEVQILADQHGTCVALGERDCSLQRRHQKVVEESPSPVVDSRLRQRMCEVAVRAARAAGYTNAGTVEFLLAPNGEFYFLEVNARLQVEHPVTELVTGLDLVQEQLRIAAGEPLGYDEAAIQRHGYAIECRINAEDPFGGYLPSTGRVVDYRAPAGPGVRLDAAIEAGTEVSVHYDPLLAKLIVWAPDRQAGLRRMARALRELLVLGVKTNIPVHLWLMEQPAFVAGAVDTGWLEREWHGQLEDDGDTVDAVALVAALLVDGQAQPTTALDGRADAPPWRLAARRAALRER